jgi:hypothetical protein
MTKGMAMMTTRKMMMKIIIYGFTGEHWKTDFGTWQWQ